RDRDIVPPGKERQGVHGVIDVPTALDEGDLQAREAGVGAVELRAVLRIERQPENRTVDPMRSLVRYPDREWLAGLRYRRLLASPVQELHSGNRYIARGPSGAGRGGRRSRRLGRRVSCRRPRLAFRV